MTITGLTTNLSSNALRRLTARASRPESITLSVEQWAKTPTYSTLSPLRKGINFHRSLARFLAKEELPFVSRPYYPFMATIRTSLRDLGFGSFETEVQIRSKGMYGRVDIVATGADGSATVEVKVVHELPDVPYAKHVIQAAIPGFLSNSSGPRKVILVYVDLIGKAVRFFSWPDHKRACIKPWELKAA